MGKDLFSKPYGRFYNLAYLLSKLGHNVELILFSYKKNEISSKKVDRLKISSVSLLPNPFKTIFRVSQQIRESKPDWVVGFSDTYYGIMAEYTARKINKKSWIDAYDNYESYIPFLKPLHWLWRNAIDRAALVTCAGPGLEELFTKYRKEGPVVVLPMTVNHNEFKELSREVCRQELGLPIDNKLIGYHGSISNSRDIDTLFAAIQKIQLTNPDVKLVMAGRIGKNIEIPKSVLYLGYIADNDIVKFINSMNILAVINKNTKFGNYSYPIKLYEAMACKIPVVVSKTKSTEWMMNRFPELLVEPEDFNALADKIDEVIHFNRIKYDELPTWDKITDKLAQKIEELNSLN
jgi:glycosyltransferase involved in cell wall biosynthesis